MRFSLIACVALMGVLAAGFSQPALADTPKCSNTQLRQQMTSDATNLAKTRQKNSDSAWQAPSSFNSLYCGVQIKSIFDSIGTNLGGAIYSMINSLLTNLVNQACASAIAPIQNAVSQLCIPFFSAPNFNISLGLSGASANYCNGMQLLSVTPVTTRPATSMSTPGAAIPLMP